MDIPGNENHSRKRIISVVAFLVVLALVIWGLTMYFQGKTAKIQNPTNSVQQPKGDNLPAPSNAVEPSNSPDKIPSTNNGEIPAPLP